MFLLLFMLCDQQCDSTTRASMQLTGSAAMNSAEDSSKLASETLVTPSHPDHNDALEHLVVSFPCCCYVPADNPWILVDATQQRTLKTGVHIFGAVRYSRKMTGTDVGGMAPTSVTIIET